MNRRLCKSNNKSVCGVCAGIGEYFGIDITLVRLVTFCLIFFGGLSIWVYIVAAIIMPEADTTYDTHTTYNSHTTYGSRDTFHYRTGNDDANNANY